MTPAAWALAALLLAIVLSVVTRLNVGVVALALAWLVGVGAGGLSPERIIQGFPASLFLTLTGVSLLFASAEANGTLERLTHRGLGLVGGQARWLPPVFFLLAGLISSAGPGAILAVALLAPLGMPLARRVGIPLFLMALMIGLGANAGNLSPISSVGVIANAKMAEAGVGGHEGKVWFANFAAHLLVAVAAFLGLRGHRLGGDRLGPTAASSGPSEPTTATRLEPRHWGTIVVIAGWILAVLVSKAPLGLSAFLAVAILFGTGTAAESDTLKRVPWGVILMVAGVSVLIGVLETTGGMDLFAGLLARLASPATATGVIAFITGAISSYSSTSGVVLPAFLPTVATLAEKVGGGDPLALALAINVGSSLVDVSPLSTLGALCVAAVADPVESAQLFRRLLIWGLSMTVVGAVLSQLLAGPLARW
ncbi:MAG: C4-dicarboxylate ABC transporter [Gemmatimonadetes bacterium]|nr:C4-dicarboxylate ABC transporter [Gemmatimonadota bacterium]